MALITPISGRMPVRRPLLSHDNFDTLQKNSQRFAMWKGSMLVPEMTRFSQAFVGRASVRHRAVPVYTSDVEQGEDANCPSESGTTHIIHLQFGVRWQ